MEETNNNRIRKVNTIVLIFLCVLLFVTIKIGFYLYKTDQQLISINTVAVIIGLVLESKRLSFKWSTIFLITASSFILSFLAFIPGNQELDYDTEGHIKLWPYWFIIFFTIISIAFHGYKMIPNLTEGITLIQSIAVIYWVLDYDFLNTSNNFLIIAILIGFGFALYSIFHAFSKTALSRSNRFILSIWSSVIMILFAADNIFSLYQSQQVFSSSNIMDKLLVAFQYFLLGVSSIYMIHNFFMLIGYFPGNEGAFDAKYFEHKRNHIKRFSYKQLNIVNSFFVLLASISIFGLNHYFKIFPRQSAIWLTFAFYPFLLAVGNYYTSKNYK